MPDGEVQMYAESRDHQDGDGEHEQDHDHAGVLGREALCAVPQAPDDEGQAQDEQHDWRGSSR